MNYISFIRNNYKRASLRERVGATLFFSLLYQVFLRGMVVWNSRRRDSDSLMPSGLKTVWLSLLAVTLVFPAIAQIASAPANTRSPWVNGTYTNLTTLTDDNSSLIPLRSVSITGAANLVDANTGNFATVSITGIGGRATISVRDTDAGDTYPVGTFAGFRIGTEGLLSATLASTVTIRLLNNGSVVQQQDVVSGLIGINTSLLGADGTATLGFISTAAFDEIQIEYNALVGLLFTAQVYHAVIQRFAAGPALDCNVQTPVSNPAYPVAVNSDRTGISGVCVGCSVENADNAINSSTSDFAQIILTAGVAATGSISVQDQITDYPAGTFAGFNIANPSLIGVNLLSGLQIQTYLNGTLRETSSSGTLLSVNSVLTGSGAQTVGFVTTQSFDEVRLVVSNLLGLLSTTNVYNVVLQRFCAGPALSCSTNSNLVTPAFPAIIDGTLTGINGVACALCSVSNTQNVIDNDPNTAASIVLAVGVGATGSIAVKDQLTTYPAGTFAGFDIQNASLIGVNLLGGVTVTTYLNGVQQESSGGNLISLELLSASRQIVGFKTTLPFNTVQIRVGNLVSVDVGTTQVYGAVLRAASAAGVVAPTLSSTAVITNSCPTTTIDLTARTVTNQPANTTITYHTSATATTANRVSTPTSVAAGTYFVAFYDAANDCYSPTSPVTATTVACPPSVAILSPATNTTVATTAMVSGTATPNAQVVLTSSTGTTLCTTTATAGGSWSCAVTLAPGSQTLTAVANNAAGNSAPATTQVTAIAAATVVINSPANGSTVANLNPPISGTATPGSSVTVQGPNGQTCITVANGSGNWTCTSLTFVNGQPASVTAVACTAGGCSSAVSSFTVAVPPTVAILSPANNTTATTTPTISGTATPGALVTITGGPGSTGGPVTVTADPVTGAYSTSAITFPAGPQTVTAIATNAGGTSTPATVSFTAVAPVGPSAGTIDCSKTQIIPAPVAGVPGQAVLVVTVNVTVAGTFSPVTVSGSGISLANGVTSVSTPTTGIQSFFIPIRYDGSALGTLSFTVGNTGSCTADLTKAPKKAITDVWTLDCIPTVGPSLK